MPRTPESSLSHTTRIFSPVLVTRWHPWKMHFRSLFFRSRRTWWQRAMDLGPAVQRRAATSRRTRGNVASSTSTGDKRWWVVTLMSKAALLWLCEDEELAFSSVNTAWKGSKLLGLCSGKSLQWVPVEEWPATYQLFL